MNEWKYKRVLLKVSGEALAGDAGRGLDFDVIDSVCDAIARCNKAGIEIGVVVGGGNFWRGLKDGKGMRERTRADHMGMLATTINCLALADILEQKGVDVRVQTAIEMRAMAEPYIRSRAIRHLEKGAKNVDGVYSADPNLDPNAVKYDTITYDDILAQHLQVMDSTATSLSMDNKIPVVLFALKDPENILRVARGEKIGTIVKD